MSEHQPLATMDDQDSGRPAKVQKTHHDISTQLAPTSRHANASTPAEDFIARQTATLDNAFDNGVREALVAGKKATIAAYEAEVMGFNNIILAKDVRIKDLEDKLAKELCKNIAPAPSVSPFVFPPSSVGGEKQWRAVWDAFDGVYRCPKCMCEVYLDLPDDRFDTNLDRELDEIPVEPESDDDRGSQGGNDEDSSVTEGGEGGAESKERGSEHSEEVSDERGQDAGEEDKGEVNNEHGEDTDDDELFAVLDFGDNGSKGNENTEQAMGEDTDEESDDNYDDDDDDDDGVVQYDELAETELCKPCNLRLGSYY